MAPARSAPGQDHDETDAMELLVKDSRRTHARIGHPSPAAKAMALETLGQAAAHAIKVPQQGDTVVCALFSLYNIQKIITEVCDELPLEDIVQVLSARPFSGP